jgi:predicted O-methyltransferase YrrM
MARLKNGNKLFYGLISRVQSRGRRAWKRHAFERFATELPEAYRQAARLVVFAADLSLDERAFRNKIEGFRNEIRSVKPKLYSFDSPASGAFEKRADGHIAPGPYRSSMDNDQSGVSMGRGTLLRRIMIGIGAKRILELGTNIGLSGSYFLSAPNVSKLVTVEGSKDMCLIAERNMSSIAHGKFTIMNTLFDDAIDHISATGDKFDCVFIDGQHERNATWHYARRCIPLLNPRGIMIFDDCHWSEDMTRFWREAITSQEFSTTIDFADIGVCIPRAADEPKRHYDLRPYV